MEYFIDKEKKYAQVWMSHSDQVNPEKNEQLSHFLDDCRSKKIFVCVYRSGKGNLAEYTKALLAYNYNNGFSNAKR